MEELAQASTKAPGIVWRVSGFILMAVLGGLAKQSHDGLSGKVFTWRQFFLRAIISSFVGILCSFFLPRGAEWSFGVCGLLGWMGTNGVVYLLDVVLRRRE